MFAGFFPNIRMFLLCHGNLPECLSLQWRFINAKFRKSEDYKPLKKTAFSIDASLAVLLK